MASEKNGRLSRQSSELTYKMRGQVQGKGRQVHVFREWVEVGELDMELDLLGLKDPGYVAEDEEEGGLRWVIPTGPGGYRLSERNERPVF